MVERSSDLWTQALVPNWSYSQQRLQPGYCQLENPHLPKCRQLHWSLECSRVKLQSKRLHRSKKEGRPPIDTSKTSNHEKVGVFIQALGDALPGPQSADPSQRWEYMRGTTLPCLPSARNRANRQTSRHALTTYKSSPGQCKESAGTVTMAMWKVYMMESSRQLVQLQTNLTCSSEVIQQLGYKGPL